MINSDLIRSYKQYSIHKKMQLIKITSVRKIALSLIFFLIVLTLIFKTYYTFFYKKKNNSKLKIISFGTNEPMKSILYELSKIKGSETIVCPKAIYIFPSILLKDFVKIFLKMPLWSIKNLDFFGALAIKVSQYYGYKVKYGIKNLLIFQEYSFYSTYLTYIFEQENGGLYNMMHGIPGKEAAFFRFTKCFVWGEYFSKFYIANGAKKNQFLIVGSLYHSQLRLKNKNYTKKYDILYAVQGNFADKEYAQTIINTLEKISIDYNLKIAIKEHPLYKCSCDIPSCFHVVDTSAFEAIASSKMVISQFSTMLLDAKVIGGSVLAFLPEKNKHLVNYLNDDEVYCEIDKLGSVITHLIFHPQCNTINENYIIDFHKNTLRLIEDEIQKIL